MPDLSVFETWIDGIAAPGDLDTWNNAFSSVDGMARLHSTKHLLRAVRELLSPHAGRPLSAYVDVRLGELP